MLTAALVFKSLDDKRLIRVSFLIKLTCSEIVIHRDTIYLTGTQLQTSATQIIFVKPFQKSTCIAFFFCSMSNSIIIDYNFLPSSVLYKTMRVFVCIQHTLTYSRLVVFSFLLYFLNKKIFSLLNEVCK